MADPSSASGAAADKTPADANATPPVARTATGTPAEQAPEDPDLHLPEQDVCAITLTPFTEISPNDTTYLPCLHRFQSSAILRHFSNGDRRCPLCRAPVPRSYLPQERRSTRRDALPPSARSDPASARSEPSVAPLLEEETPDAEVEEDADYDDDAVGEDGEGPDADEEAEAAAAGGAIDLDSEDEAEDIEDVEEIEDDENGLPADMDIASRDGQATGASLPAGDGCDGRSRSGRPVRSRLPSNVLAVMRDDGGDHGGEDDEEYDSSDDSTGSLRDFIVDSEGDIDPDAEFVPDSEEEDEDDPDVGEEEGHVDDLRRREEEDEDGDDGIDKELMELLN